MVIYTPGPWRTFDTVSGPSDWPRYTPPMAGFFTSIHAVMPDTEISNGQFPASERHDQSVAVIFGQTETEVRANAALVQAAPELLDLLKQAHQQLLGYDVAHPGLMRLLGEIEGAIARINDTR